MHLVTHKRSLLQLNSPPLQLLFQLFHTQDRQGRSGDSSVIKQLLVESRANAIVSIHYY